MKGIGIKMRWLVLLAVFVLLSGCATYIPAGALYVGGKMGVQSLPGETPKEGKACMTSILGLVAIGDASIEAAKTAGGVKDVLAINYEVSNILGIYGTYCIIVKGR